MNTIRKKLSSSKGETILETLVALLIIVMAISFLTAAIEKSNRIVGDIKKVNEGFTYDGEIVGDLDLEIIDDEMMIDSERYVTVYKVKQFEGAEDNNLYYYYYEP